MRNIVRSIRKLSSVKRREKKVEGTGSRSFGGGESNLKEGDCSEKDPGLDLYSRQGWKEGGWEERGTTQRKKFPTVREKKNQKSGSGSRRKGRKKRIR